MRRAAALVAAGWLLVAGSASAHVIGATDEGPKGGSGDLGVPGLSEQKLRDFEAHIFGPEHAAEHARERSEARLGIAATGQSALLPPAKPTPAQYKTQGRWGAAFNIPVIGINAIMLPTGKVMWFAYPVNANERWGEKNAPNTAQAFLWDPAKGTYKRIDPPILNGKPVNIWCAGQTLLADGRVLVAGGNLTYARTVGGVKEPFTGLNKVYTFNPWNEKWTEQPSMAHGRWYPSVARLGDGRAIIMSGLNESAAENSYGDTYNPNLGIDAFTPSADLDGKGTLKPLGDRLDLRDGFADPGTTGPPDGGLYPHLFWMPTGRLMVAGPDPADSWFLHDPLAGFNLDTGWDDIPSASRRRLWGSGVLAPSQTPGHASTKVELLGGTVDETPAANTDAATGNTNTTETFDEADGGAGTWHNAAPMNVDRSHLNTVLTPTGSMISLGGGMGTTTAASGSNQWTVSASHSERAVDIYDPATNAWHLGAQQNEDRAYHSTALLLPDGRIVSAGDDYNGAGGPGTGIRQDTAQVYVPPYLYNQSSPTGALATRPTLTSVSNRIAYGSTFTALTPDLNVTRATLVAPGATTHANDMNQRMMPLKLAQATGGVKLTAPAGATAAPPGWYMLFLVNAQGVPSVAKWVQLGANPPALGRIELIEHVSGSARFSFAGAPFDGVTLANGGSSAASVAGGPSITKAGGHYTIAQAARSGYSLTAVSCDDRDSTESLASRSVRVNLAAGETVRCTFTNKAKPAAKKPAAKADKTGPLISFTGFDRRRHLLKGRVKDGSGIARLDAGLARKWHGRCRWWSARRHRFARSRRRCSKPAWIRAKVKRSHRRLVWTAKLHGRPRKGHYVVALRARDDKGNRTYRTGRKAAKLSVKR